IGAAADPADAFAAIDRVPLVILCNERRIARVFNLPRDLIESVVPRDVFPMIRTGPPHLRFQEPALIQNILFERSAFRAERAAIDRMIWIALDVHDLRRGVLGSVTQSMDDHAATDRAVGTGRACLGGACDLERLRLRAHRRETEAESR